jgi:hypothetical protein
MRSHVIEQGIGQRASGIAAASPVATLSELTQSQREKAMLRARALVLFRAWRESDAHTLRDFGGFAAVVERELGLPVKRRTLYLWHEQAPAGSAAEDLPAIALALADRRGCRAAGGVDHDDAGAPADAAWAMFVQLYLTPNQWSARKCWRTVAAAASTRGWSWPGYRRVAQLISERLDPGQVAYHREGQSAWRKQFAAPFQQDPDAFAPNECWEADHSRFDLFVQAHRGGRVVGVRPWLTLWMDRRSRRIMGWWIDYVPCGDTIRWALLEAVGTAPMGPPRRAWLDNGRDFKSAANVGLTRREIARVQARGGYWLDAALGMGVLGMLGVEGHFAQAYNHNGKARIERLFGTIHTDFDREFESWCGSRPGHRDKDTLDLVTAEAEQLPTIAALRERFGEWVTWYNARSEHGIQDLVSDTGERLSPDAMLALAPEKRVMPDPRALDLLRPRWSRALKVGKRGISLQVGGRTIRYGDLTPELEALKNTEQRVLVSIDTQDISSVRVFDEQLRFLCIAPMNRQYGGARRDPITLAAWKAAHAARRAQEKAARRLPDVAALLLPPAELAAREQRRMDLEQRATSDEQRAPAPAPLRLAATPLDGQAARVERAETSRAAKRLATSPERQRAGEDDDIRIDLAACIEAVPAPADEDDDEIDLGSLVSVFDDDHDDDVLEVLT